MGKKLAAALLAIALLSGCAKQEPPPKKGTVVATTGRSSSAVESAPEPVELDKQQQQFLDDFSNRSFKITAETPETRENTSVQVNVDTALAGQIAALLVQSAFEADIEAPLNDPEKEARVLTVEARGDKQYSRVTFYGFEQGHPFYAGKTLVVLENSTGATRRYLYDASVFEAADRELRTRTGGVAVQFNGNNVRLLSKYDLTAVKRERGLWAGEFLQFGNQILWRFAAGDPAKENSQVELLSAANGSVLQSYSVAEPVRRMEKYDGPEGGDYRLFTPTRVIFRDTANPSWKQEWVLPGSVRLFTASEQMTGGYDLRFGKFAYAAEDGVYLASASGGEERLILAHSALDTVMKGKEGGQWYFNDPRLMMDGDKLVTAIVGTQTGDARLGFAVSDLKTFETTYYTDMHASSDLTVRYIDDRVVAAQEIGRLTLLDTETMEVGALSLPVESEIGGSVFYFSEDYKKFLVYESSPEIKNQPSSAALYLCDADELDARGSKLLSISGDVFYPLAITENYLIGYCEDSLGVHYTAAKYDNRKKATGASSERPKPTQTPGDNETPSSSGRSYSSSSSSSGWDEEIGTLPPDITPDWMQNLLLQSALRTRGGNLEGIAPYLGTSSEDDFLSPYQSWFD